MKKNNHVNGKKQCSCCGKWKDATLKFFFKDVRRWDCLTHRCKECRIGAHRKWYDKQDKGTKNKLAKQSKICRDKLRLDVLSHYGNNGEIKCACCSESHIEFLAIDHVGGSGNKHRRHVGCWGTSFYYWLRRHGYPDGYQILCHNCNFAKSWGGCPHEKERRPV